jgi:hypothetical protein
MDKITHEMRLMQWTPVIRDCRGSGMTVRSWCIENNINIKQFYYWQRRIREKAYEALERPEAEAQSKFVQLPVPADSYKCKSSFNTDMVIHIGGTVLEISNTASEELLSNVLKVISNAK